MMDVSFCSVRLTAAMVQLVMLILPCNAETLGSGYESIRMTPAAHCPGQVIAWAHRYQTLGARSVLECVALCRPDEGCVTVVYDKDQSVCYLGNGTAEEDCSNTMAGSTRWKYFERVQQCENGGVLTADGGNCTCPDGYYGNRCQVTMAVCEEYVERGFLTKSGESKGVYYIKPGPAPTPFPVYCDYIPSGIVRTRVAVREDPSYSFNRTWQEYRQGFGQPDSAAYWLGLERMHLLTRGGGYQLRFRVRYDNGTDYFQFYNNFALGDSASGYAVSFSPNVVNRALGDCMLDLRGAPFSAYDVDNDDTSSVNCALQHGAGWWFKGDNCSTCSPLGPILPPFDGWRKGVKGEAFWTFNLGDNTPFPFFISLVAQP